MRPGFYQGEADSEPDILAGVQNQGEKKEG
jgi:hypothetical protein